MPQATSELTEKWDGPSDEKAIAHLRSKGFRYTKHWEWIPPVDYRPTEEDVSAIMFLIQEWDWGGLAPEAELR